MTLASETVFKLHPAAILINHAMVVQAFGPTATSFAPSLACGRCLTDLFDVAPCFDAAMLPLIAANQDPLILVSKERNVRLRGTLYAEGTGYLIVAKPALQDPILATDALQIADFAPDDPFVEHVLQIALLRGLREDAENSARDLMLAWEERGDMLAHLQRVTGFISHEFSNLLSIIQLNCDRVAKVWAADPNLWKAIMLIRETAIRGGSVSQWLRALSGDADLAHREPLDDFLRGTSGLLQALCGANVTVTTALEAGAAKMDGSLADLMNCLIGLIRTAVADDAGGGHAHITTALPTHGDDHAAKTVLVSVHVESAHPLNGAKLLSAQYQSFLGHSSAKTTIEEFVRSVGGTVRFHSVSERSGTVTMQIPQDISHAPLTPSATVEPSDPLGKTGHLVVVEDEAAALEALLELLEFEGFTTTGCRSAEEALVVLAERPDAILITDVVLPKMDGLTLAHQAMSAFPDRKVIIMTGHIPNYAHYDEEWVFLQKPLDVDHLVKILQSSGR